ncbi:MAG: Rrf2 family transcriptional regulator [Sulfurospirillum sp.]|nr:Rrf2 family transcriptional regulator [Sulfurospirillum sp.]
MHFSKTLEYSILILSYIAIHNKEKISSALLNETLKIPYKYLTKLITILVKAGLINSQKGRNGGISLGKPACEITIALIMNALDEDLQEGKCILVDGKCDPKNPCIMHNTWLEPRSLLEKIIHKTTLEDFILQRTPK